MHIAVLLLSYLMLKNNSTANFIQLMYLDGKK